MPQIAKIINGWLNLPCFIFIKATGRFSDNDLLGKIGAADYLPVPVKTSNRRPDIFITEDDAWIHIVDSNYNLWNKGWRKLSDSLHEMLPEVSIFACSVGDIDWSFDFSYHSSGKLQRRLIVEDPKNAKQRIVVENFGLPLAAEKDFSAISDELEYVLSLAASLGIKFDHKLKQMRCYQKPV